MQNVCNLCCFVTKSVFHAVLSRNLFCHSLRAFMWRKLELKSTFVEKKWQISGLVINPQKQPRNYQNQNIINLNQAPVTLSNWLYVTYAEMKENPGLFQFRVNLICVCRSLVINPQEQRGSSAREIERDWNCKKEIEKSSSTWENEIIFFAHFCCSNSPL